ncbi:MAG TPA: PIN domain-containing protein [Pirellulales bacterium]|nr:PIN domain-containing protein [Pirellulales bacterium]
MISPTEIRATRSTMNSFVVEATYEGGIVAEMAHRLMAIEAINAFGWPVKQIAQRLRKNFSHVQRLTLFRQAIQELPTFGVQLLSVRFDLLDAAAAVTQRCGLLTNDAIVVAVMQAHKSANLASNDGDFDREPSITRFAPA